jgi:hypothetical protein
MRYCLHMAYGKKEIFGKNVYYPVSAHQARFVTQCRARGCGVRQGVTNVDQQTHPNVVCEVCAK